MSTWDPLTATFLRNTCPLDHGLNSGTTGMVSPTLSVWVVEKLVTLSEEHVRAAKNLILRTDQKIVFCGITGIWLYYRVELKKWFNQTIQYQDSHMKSCGTSSHCLFNPLSTHSLCAYGWPLPSVSITLSPPLIFGRPEMIKTCNPRFLQTHLPAPRQS